MSRLNEVGKLPVVGDGHDRAGTGVVEDAAGAAGRGARLLRTTPLFPTLLGEAEHPAPDALNRDLEEYIRRREASERGVSAFTTVNSGWQSSPDVFHDDVPPLRALRRFIDDQLAAFFEDWGRVSFGVPQHARFRFSYAGWAVILRRGGFQHEHVHTKTDVTGIYYVRVPEDETLSPGDLTLLDPRAGRVASRSIWETAHFSTRPKAGKLVLFPSFLPHRVDQVDAPGERISINFDVSLQGTM